MVKDQGVRLLFLSPTSGKEEEAVWIFQIHSLIDSLRTARIRDITCQKQCASRGCMLVQISEFEIGFEI
jgi:hypothetical protein